LVLSGGGAKGFAYWGFKVLEEAGVRLIILVEPAWVQLWAVFMHQDIMQLKLILSSKQQTSMSCSTILDAFKEFF
jgi:hypothetical protein